MALLTVSGMSATASGQTTTSTTEPSPAASSKGVVNKTDGKRVLSYWTEERIRAATPEPIPSSPPLIQKGEPPQNVLPGREAEGSRPTRKLDQPIGPSADILAGAQAERWQRQGSMPAITIGKIYYVRNNGTPGYCSGSVITAANKNTVWTSGHCIHAGGGGEANWYSDFIFVPDTDNGLEPHGRWTWRYAATANGWYEDGDWSYDVAAIAFDPQPARGNLQDWVGSQGYRFGYGQDFTDIHAFGYPEDGYQRTDFTGDDLWYCFGNVSRAGILDDRMHMDNDMFHGSSGGPWLQELQLDRGWGYIIGANSHRDVDDDENPTSIVYKSPNHGDAALNIYNDVTAN
ncbi:hypothetical protein [Nonomuraea sp. B5E05]|uniref:trypsin-like serine peptidase n=1 Tax=Nonomuraea sp. B5E05 TaxID=3153569 RepID=UPI003260DCA2